MDRVAGSGLWMGFSGPTTYIYKKIRYQKLIDHFRKLYHSQGFREFHSSRLLSKIGIPAPKVYGYGFSLWSSEYESFLLAEFIPNKGTLREVFSRSTVKKRQSLFDELIHHLQLMINHGVYHKDAHPGNILVTEEDHLIWIDNDLSPIRGKRETERLFKKFLRNPLFNEEERERLQTLLEK
ncbi:lipopolysaccharide kinase InaA family protein [Nitratifractor sp.]